MLALPPPSPPLLPYPFPSLILLLLSFVQSPSGLEYAGPSGCFAVSGWACGVDGPPSHTSTGGDSEPACQDPQDHATVILYYNIICI